MHMDAVVMCYERQTDRMTAPFQHIHLPFFPSYKLSKTITACTILLFGLIILLCGLKCGTFVPYFERYPVKDLFCCQTVNGIII